MRRGLLAVISSVVFLFTLLAISAPVNAQAKTGSGMRISPVRSEATINPGESKSSEIYITNVTDAPVTLKAIINDFGASDDETGEPRLYLDANSSAPSHGLKKYVSAIPDIQLQPKEQKTVKVTITIPKDAAGGGYYGAVRFAPSNTSSSEGVVSLSGSVGTLYLITVPGDVVEKGSIKSLNVARMNGTELGKASSFFTNGAKDEKGKGIQAVIRIANSGNVQIAPFGKALLKKSGKEIASYELNNVSPRGNVLPDSTRKFTIDLGDNTKSFGKYTLEGNFGYGTSGQLISAKTTFYVVPLSYILMLVGLILLIIAAILIAPRLLKSHDRKLIRKLRGSRRKR